MDYSKYRQKYINFIDDYGYDDTKFKDHYIFEILYALELNLILWSDIPPNFDELYDLPHTMDYGVDLIDLEYTRTGQVKKYCILFDFFDTHDLWHFCSSIWMFTGTLFVSITPTDI